MRRNGLVEVTSNFQELKYQPRTKETRSVYESILVLVYEFLEDSPRDVLQSATDEIIVHLKEGDIADPNLKRGVESWLDSKLSEEKFVELYELVKRLVDFNDVADVGSDGTKLDETGVAVVFDKDKKSAESTDGSESTDDEWHFSSDSEIDENDADEESQPLIVNDEARVDEEAAELDSKASLDVDDGEEVLRLAKQSSMGQVELEDVDAFWLQRMLSTVYPDAHAAQAKAESVFSLLSQQELSTRDFENQLVETLDFDHFKLCKLIVRNRYAIYWGTRLARTAPEGQEAVRKLMQSSGEQLKLSDTQMDVDRVTAIEERDDMYKPQTKVDLAALLAPALAHKVIPKIKLPEGSFKKLFPEYEEVRIPAPAAVAFQSNERLVPITELPQWTHQAFSGAETLNRVQSQLYKAAFESDERLLLCAPTGAGKTNVALLALLRAIGRYRSSGEPYKLVYMAPMKALVQEVVQQLSSRLAYLEVQVRELSGDAQLSKEELKSVHIIVTTPEKWDIVTRKADESSVVKLVRLVIIDEVHLLQDSRGPVLEAVVCRTKPNVRIVGLSATLPNYKEVAEFLAVDQKRGLFFFDSSYRPCPLEQTVVGITTKKAAKRQQLMNDIVYQKVAAGEGGGQFIVFVHSRKDTVKTAQFIANSFTDAGKVLISDSASLQILKSEAENVRDSELKNLLPLGVGVHHAGLTKSDRVLVEDLFANGHMLVLLSTATLAWGVNLPAHTVIIKGVHVYNPERGSWDLLSPQDVLQMLGRAGRPQYDTFGEGILITPQSDLAYYLGVLNSSLPLESQFLTRLCDWLNAEVVLESVKNIRDAVLAIKKTFLAIRMRKNPQHYGLLVDSLHPKFAEIVNAKLVDWVHAAFLRLEKHRLVQYNHASGKVQPTEVGRLASFFYLSDDTVALFNDQLKPGATIIDLLRIFSLAKEFAQIPVREEEKLELKQLAQKVPVPLREAFSDASAKINVLLQVYISRINLQGFALVADMHYVVQSASRLWRALFQLACVKGWAQLSQSILEIAQMVEHRMWSALHPLRQLPNAPLDIVQRLERKDIPWSRYFELTPAGLGELLGRQEAGQTLYKLVKQFPQVSMEVRLLPLSAKWLRLELYVSCNVASEAFWIFVEDTDAERLLQYRLVYVHEATEGEYTFIVPFDGENRPPNYFVSIVSDKFLHCSVRMPVLFRKMVLPEPDDEPMEAMDMEPLPSKSIDDSFFKTYCKHLNIEDLGPVETQVYETISQTNRNAVVFASYRLFTVASMALSRHFSTRKGSKAVVVSNYCLDPLFEQWSRVLANESVSSTRLVGEFSDDLDKLAAHDLIFCTPTQWDQISRRWQAKAKEAVSLVGLFIAEGVDCPTTSLEVCCSRMRYLTFQLDLSVRFVGLGFPVANAQDLGSWLGVESSADAFSFNAMVRPVPLELHLKSFTKPDIYFMLPALLEAVHSLPKLPSGSDAVKPFSSLQALIFVKDEATRKVLLEELGSQATAYQPHGEAPGLVEKLMVVLKGEAWALSSEMFENLSLLVICDHKPPIESFRAVTNPPELYPLRSDTETSIQLTLHIASLTCCSRGFGGKCLLYCHSLQKDLYRALLLECFPAESLLDSALPDLLNTEIASRIVESKQDAVDFLTWSLYYKRLSKNPNFYGIPIASHQSLSEHLSELVEASVEELVDASCIAADDDTQLDPLNLGLIAQHYYLSTETIKILSQSVEQQSTLLELVGMCARCPDLSACLQFSETSKLRETRSWPLSVSGLANTVSEESALSRLILAHCTRLSISPHWMSELHSVLSNLIKIIHGAVDVAATKSLLKTAYRLCNLCAMVVQAVWKGQSPLKQLPILGTGSRLEHCLEQGISSIPDILDLSDERRGELLHGLSESEQSMVATFANRYPDIAASCKLVNEETLSPGSVAVMLVIIEWEQVDCLHVIAPFLPATYAKEENWWALVGHEETGQLFGIKKVARKKLEEHSSQMGINFQIPDDFAAGSYELDVHLICDSYVGCEQVYKVKVSVEALPMDVHDDSSSCTSGDISGND